MLYRKILSGCLLLGLSSNVALANDIDSREDEEDEFDGHFQVILMTGVAATDQHGSIRVTSDEKDNLVQTNKDDWDIWTFQAGLGYAFPLIEEDPDCLVNWFPYLTPQLNAYLLNDKKIHGDVYRFQNSHYNQATYEMNFNSKRLMFDLGLDILSSNNFTFYGLAGAGIAWNRTDFSLDPNDGVHIVGLDLGETDSTGFAYEFGAGITYDLNSCIGISLEYLYTFLDDVKFSGESDGFDVHSSDVNIQTQSLLLGLRISF